MFDARMFNAALEVWAVVLCAVGIASALLFAHADERFRRMLVGMFAAELVMTGGDALAGFCRGHVDVFSWIMTHVGNFATYGGGFILMVFLTHYLCARIKEADGSFPVMSRWVYCVAITAVFMLVLLLLGVFYTIDEANVYHRTDWYWIAQAFPLAVNLINATLLWRSRRSLGRRALVSMLFLALAPALSSIVQAFIYGLNFNIIASVVGTVVVFLEMQRHSSQMLVARTEELAATQVEASENRIAVMVSQIQPHFLFNTLDTIYGLVDEDTEKAKEAIASFSRYLRANLDSLKHTTPVPIEREMEHVRTYLELEHMSDEGRLEYEFDIQATGFLVPALSVQTIAENAVKHGLGGREEGGRVIVSTREQATEFTVAVIDNGIGFDPESNASTGIGLTNTQARLEAMCGGSLEVNSNSGEGTTVVLHIPKSIEGGL